MYDNSNIHKNYDLNHEDKKLRWRVKDDIKMFHIFKRNISLLGYSTQEFLGPIKSVSKSYKHVLKALIKDCGWRGKSGCLLKRIRKLLKKNDFSTREIRKLKKLIRENIKGLVTIEKIAEQFPGKTVDQINEFKSTYNPRI